jgi:hypothetical protein
MKGIVLRVLGGIVAYAVAVSVIYIYAPRLRERPFASLSEPGLSEVYNSSFWMHERAAHSDLWKRALSSCESADPIKGSRPNCSILAVVANAAVQEKSVRHELAKGRRMEQRIVNGANGENGNGLSGEAAKPGELPRPQTPKTP